jgi:hypothetical protein
MIPASWGANLSKPKLALDSAAAPQRIARDQDDPPERGKHLLMKCLRLLKGHLFPAEAQELQQRFADAPTPTFDDDEPSPGPGWRERVTKYLRDEGMGERAIRDACGLVELGMKYGAKHGGDKAGLDDQRDGEEEGWRGQATRFMKSRGLSGDEIQEVFRLGPPHNALQTGPNGRLAPGNRLGEDAAAAERVRSKFGIRIEPEPSRPAQRRLAYDGKALDRLEERGVRIKRVLA